MQYSMRCGQRGAKSSSWRTLPQKSCTHFRSLKCCGHFATPAAVALNWRLGRFLLSLHCRLITLTLLSKARSATFHSTSPRKHALLCLQLALTGVADTNDAPRLLRGFRWCERQFRRRSKPEQVFMAKSKPASTKADQATPSIKIRKATKQKPVVAVAEDQVKKTKAIEKKDKPRGATKQDNCLDLLRRPNGATIEDMMDATDWQAHSVRGFLAGTVKKRLGLNLVSAKSEDDARRYRIGASGGR